VYTDQYKKIETIIVILLNINARYRLLTISSISLHSLLDDDIKRLPPYRVAPTVVGLLSGGGNHGACPLLFGGLAASCSRGPSVLHSFEASLRLLGVFGNWNYNSFSQGARAGPLSPNSARSKKESEKAVELEMPPTITLERKKCITCMPWHAERMKNVPINDQYDDAYDDDVGKSSTIDSASSSSIQR